MGAGALDGDRDHGIRAIPTGECSHGGNCVTYRRSKCSLASIARRSDKGVCRLSPYTFCGRSSRRCGRCSCTRAGESSLVRPARSVQIQYARLQRGACHNHGPWCAEQSLELVFHPRPQAGHPAVPTSVSGFSELSLASAHCAAGRARERVGCAVWIRTEIHFNVLEFVTCGWGRRTCLACSTTYICTYGTRDAPLCASDDGAGLCTDMYRNCGSSSTPSSEDRTYPIETLVRRGFELRASRPELLQYDLGAPGSPEPEPMLGGR